MIYTLVNTCIPGFVLAPAARIDFTAPEGAPASPPSEPATAMFGRADG
jgi:hypothetical protein